MARHESGGRFKAPFDPVHFEYAEDESENHANPGAKSLDPMGDHDSNSSGRGSVLSVLAKTVREQGARISALESRLEKLRSH